MRREQGGQSERTKRCILYLNSVRERDRDAMRGEEDNEDGHPAASVLAKSKRSYE